MPDDPARPDPELPPPPPPPPPYLQQRPAAPPAARVRKKPAWRWFVVAVIGASAVFIGIATSTQPKGEYEGRTIRFDVSGEAPRAWDIEYTTNDDLVLLTDVPLPWSTSFTAGSRLQFDMSARGTGAMFCRITVDGVEVDSMNGLVDGSCSAMTPVHK